MQSLGEMTTWLPLPGAIPQFCGRYVDEALGFAVGWNVSSLYCIKRQDEILISIGMVFRCYCFMR
jgi:amino acid permease